MTEERRAVLERVARGEISPAEAAALLDDMERRSAARAVDAPPEPEPAHEQATRIRVTRLFGVTEVIGDPDVREAVAEGPHVAHRQGGTLVIEGETDESAIPGFFFNWQWRGRHRHARRHGFDFPGAHRLRVRVNPQLPLEVESQAGKVRVHGVRAPIRAEIQAGSTEIDGFLGPLDVRVQAGSLRAHGRLTSGASRIQCEAGGVSLHLEKGASVRVSAHSTLGPVTFNGEMFTAPVTVGGGEATLDISATLGSVRVTTE